MYQVIYLSPTGNTKLLAEHLCMSLNSEAIELRDFQNNTKKHLVFMYPIHGFNPPRTFKRFIKNLPKGDNNISLIAVGVTKSWINHSVSSKLKRKLKRKGYSIMIDSILAMPITIVMDMKPELKKSMKEHALNDINQISEQLQNGTETHLHPKLHSRMIKQVGKVEDFASRLFGLELHANKDCTLCGICVKGCPEQNIRINPKNKLKFSFSCMMCM